MGSCESDQNSFQVTLKLYNNTQAAFSVLKQTTIKELKELIYQNYYDQLLPALMVLEKNGVPITLNTSLGQISLDRKVEICQRKAELWELEELKTENRYDDIFGQMGVAFMQCGHAFSRTAMRETIKVQINAGQQHYITCPYSKQGQNALCLQIFANQECRLIAGYVRDEWNQIQEKLAINFSKKTTKQCPQCKNFISRSGVTTKKVQCPLSVCKTYFCIECGDKWKQGKNDCFSQACNVINQIIARAPRQRRFLLIEKTKQKKIFYAPNIRACPKCKCLIMNVSPCKHTKCFCGTKFCFLCLSVFNQKSSVWPCGGAYEYCGVVAPNQKFKNAL